MRRSYLLCALVLGACSTDTFNGGDDGGADATDDVPPINGGDGGVDAKLDVTVEAAQPRYCAGIDAQFCADFDKPGDPAMGFASPTEDGGYVLSFVDGGVSPPTAAKVDVAASSPGYATIGAAISGNASTSTELDFKIFIKDFQSGPYPPVSMFVFGIAGGESYVYTLTYGSGVWTLSNLSNTKSQQLSGTVPVDQWADVKVQVGLSNTSGSVVLTISAGNDSASASLQGPTLPTVSAAPVVLSLGVISSAALSQSPSVFYDNVVVYSK